MSVNCHNSGKLCWSLLGDSISYKIEKKKEGITGDDIKYIWSIDSKKVDHFSYVMENVIKDFAETYKKEDKYELNPTKWKYGYWLNSAGGQTSYSDSLITIYIYLNLILLNSKLNETPLLTYPNSIYDVCSGNADLTPDEYLVSKFIKIKKKLFERYGENSFKYEQEYLQEQNFKYRIKLTKELVEEIRDYLKEVFVCLIRLYQSEEHRQYVSSWYIERDIRWVMGG